MIQFLVALDLQQFKENDSVSWPSSQEYCLCSVESDCMYQVKGQVMEVFQIFCVLTILLATEDIPVLIFLYEMVLRSHCEKNTLKTS